MINTNWTPIIFMDRSWMIMALLSICFTHPVRGTSDTLRICNPGDAIQLQARRGQYAYRWSPPLYLDNPTVDNPLATPDTNITYIVTMIPSLVGNNLIKNPDFNQGREEFTSEYIYVERINTQGVYSVNESAYNLNPVYFSDCPDHTTGEGQMLVVDGSPEANRKVWCQSIQIKSNTDYAFSTWLTSVGRVNPPILQFFINNELLGPFFRASDRICEWRQFFETWNSGQATEAEICIINQNTNPQGNDFAMDDFSFFELEDIIHDTFSIVIDKPSISSLSILRPDCDQANGQVEIIASGDELQYAISPDYGPSNLFTDLTSGTYALFVKDKYECAIDTQIVLASKICPIYIPNAFSPNGDGINDQFKLYAHGNFSGKLHLIVYNRWGSPVFQSAGTDPSQIVWDGYYQGNKLSSGVYVYYLEVESDEGEKKLRHGTISLVN